MLNLENVRDFAQQVADAFAAVLDYEVAIIDNELKVIAGTGRYKEEVNTQYGSGCMTSRLIKNPDLKVLTVEDPESSKLCGNCGARDNCPVWAVIMCPINFSNHVIGSISLMALNETQRKSLINNRSKVIAFLSKVANFIASNLGEKEIKSEMKFMADRFKAVINSVHEGIIAVDDKGKITHINSSAERILEIEDDDRKIEEVHINQFFSDFNLDAVVENMTIDSSEHFETKIEYKQKNKKFHLFCNITLIRDEGKIRGVTISFRKLDEIKELADKIITENDDFTFDSIKGTSSKFVEVKKRMRKVARTDSTVLIRGESGTGKSMFAQAMHKESERRDGPFVTVNCAAIPESLLESELFGYEEGAFTGAKKGGKPGKFELAHKGTIFLDEIGDMPTHFQVKLLKAIESKKIERVGGVESIDIDVRIIAATHQDLEKMVSKGEFRKDLFYRLNVIPFRIPPLRERREDITLLLHFFLKKYASLLNKEIKGFTDGAREALVNYSWPGNVRELENCVEYSVNIETANYITKKNLPHRIINYDSTIDQTTQIPTIAQLEKKAIIKALKRFGTSGKAKEKAAETLGISRATLYRKLKKHEINLSQKDIDSQKEKILS